jgi:hypothetical protein
VENLFSPLFDAGQKLKPLMENFQAINRGRQYSLADFP